MNRRYEQQGMTIVGWIIVLVLVGAVALLVLKVVPVYVESFKVEKAVQAVAKEAGIAEMSNRNIYKKFIARMDVEDVDRFSQRNIHKHLDIKKKGPVVTLTISYTEITPLVHNISLKFDFQHQANNR